MKSICERLIVGNNITLILLTLLVIAVMQPQVAVAQRKSGSNKPTRDASNGTIKVWVPVGIIGPDYWIYADDRVHEVPDRRSLSGRVAVVMRMDGSGWEAFGQDGRIVSSTNWNNWVQPYVTAGDKYSLFKPFELKLPVGSHTIELLVSTTRRPSSMGPLPFAVSRKYAVDLNSGQIVNVFPEVPTDWNNRLGSAPVARWVSPCREGSFKLQEMQESYNIWAQNYSSNPVVKLLHRVKSGFTPGVATVELPVPGGTREFNRAQMQMIVALATPGFVGRFSNDRDEVAMCKAAFPQYSKAISEFEKILYLVEDDLASLKKMVDGMR